MLNGELLPAKKPDIDNIVKAVLDALNEVAYRDDTQVVELQVRKQYSERPRLEICNERLEEFLSFEKGKDQEGSNCTRLAYKIVGITDKGTAAGSQLDDLSLVEHLIAHTLRTGMAAGRGYKDIYLDCKHRLESMKYLQCTA